MKLATIKSSHRQGALVVVSQDNSLAARVDQYPTLLDAMRQWKEARPELEKIYTALNRGTAKDSFPLTFDKCLAPLPTSPGFYDGSAFLSHVHAGIRENDSFNVSRCE
jgi:fumarylacetoacetate (FAA) hydrolase